MKYLRALICLLLLNCTSVWAGEYAYRWSFGDGHYSSEENPEYEYKKPGIYTVTLDVLKHNEVVSSKQHIVDLITPLIDSVIIQHEQNQKSISLQANLTLKEAYPDLVFRYQWLADGTLIGEGNPVSLTNATHEQYKIELNVLFGDTVVTSQQEMITVVPATEGGGKSSSGGVIKFLFLIILLSITLHRRAY